MPTPQGLGSDGDTCVSEVIEAMRSQILADAPDPAAGAALAQNLASPEVRRNLAPLGEALYRVLTVHARSIADGTTDQAFWDWTADVHARLAALEAWQQGIAKAFEGWGPSSESDAALRDAVLALPAPPASSAAAPGTLGGRIA